MFIYRRRRLSSTTPTPWQTEKYEAQKKKIRNEQPLSTAAAAKNGEGPSLYRKW
jgi:hypothetical protein